MWEARSNEPLAASRFSVVVKVEKQYFKCLTKSRIFWSQSSSIIQMKTGCYYLTAGYHEWLLRKFVENFERFWTFVKIEGSNHKKIHEDIKKAIRASFFSRCPDWICAEHFMKVVKKYLEELVIFFVRSNTERVSNSL